MAGVYGQLRGFDFWYSGSRTDSFYTAFPANEVNLDGVIYSFGGSNVWYLFASQRTGTVPVHRYYNDSREDHYFTRTFGSYSGYVYEGIVGYAWPSSGSSRVAVNGYYNASVVDHAYTTGGSPGSGYASEGIAWYSPIVVTGCSDPNASNYNPDVNQTSSGCTYPAPTASISLNPTSIINDGVTTSKLTWSSSGVGLSNITVTDVTNPAYNDNTNVRPTSTKTYTISVTGTGGTTTRSATLTVYQPPVFTLSLDRNPIIAGESTSLRWSTTGDANTISWTAGGITNQNLNSFSTVNPTDSRTYSATVSGLGGSDSDSIRLVVYQIPTATITVPSSLNYGSQGTISYSSSYSNTTLKITPSYTYDTVVTGTAINLTKPTSAENGVGTTSVSGTLTTSIPYTTRGPRSVSYLIEASGSGGSVSRQATITINIDETPDSVIIPETEDVIKSQDPVVTPDVTVTSMTIQMDDIDIPVEIKSDRPIQVDINGQQNWRNIRQL